MNRNTIRLIVILGTLSVIGIIAVQTYWTRKAFDLKEQQFRQTVQIALQNVANRISILYKLSKIENPVSQVSSDYYVVNLRSDLHADVLEYYLKEEFKKQHLNTDFEYGIYDCDTEKIVYGSYISANYVTLDTEPQLLPKTNKFVYYFGVRFPSKTSYLFSKLDIWLISSFITMLVTVFFGYAMFVILKQKRLSEIQRDFINNMTHEFQTPISTIKIATDVLGQAKIMEQPDRLRKYVQIIKQENNRLKNQVESVLNTARFERGAMDFKPELQDLHALIHEACESVRMEDEQNLHLSLHAEKATVVADRKHLLSVINNLLDNAVKYSQEQVDVAVETNNVGNSLIFSVSDKGIGIPKAYQHRIFDKFFRVPTGNVHNVKGFGLGLSYVKKIIDLHGWTISLESTENQGTCFHIAIPQSN